MARGRRSTRSSKKAEEAEESVEESQEESQEEKVGVTEAKAEGEESETAENPKETSEEQKGESVEGEEEAKAGLTEAKEEPKAQKEESGEVEEEAKEGSTEAKEEPEAKKELEDSAAKPSEKELEDGPKQEVEVKNEEGAKDSVAKPSEAEGQSEKMEVGDGDDKSKSAEEADERMETNEKAGESDKKRSASGDDSDAAKNGDEPPSKKTKSDADEPSKKKRSPDLAKFWKAVEDDPKDFTGWTYLLQFVDTTGDIGDGREAYDAFLFRYPYCYGYWKKYADLEKRKGTGEKCMEVFERGMESIPLSADLWIHYLNHVKSEFGGKPDYVRTQYERAIAGCGREWRSDKLWDHYVKWEVQFEKDNEVGAKNYHRVVAIYDRILQNPTQGLSHQFDKFKEFVKEHSPKDILDVNDFLNLRKEVLASLKKDDNDTESKEAPGENEGEDEKCSDEENTAMREKIIAARKKVYKATEERVQLRWKYEDAIKRPYFHMKPLERGQLKNWNEYLDFEERHNAKNGVEDQSNLEILYERCLIACALYEEFWTKYVGWLRRLAEKATGEAERAAIEDKVVSVFDRACTHHLPDKTDIHLAWAAYEEEKGRPDKAAGILANLEAKNPHMLSVVLRRINLARRRGDIQAVHGLYRDCISKAKTRAARSDLAVKYSRYLRLALDDAAAASDVLEKAAEQDPRNPKLYLQLLDIELHAQPLAVDTVVALLDRAIGVKDMSGRHKLLFSQRKVEFLEDFGADVRQLLAAKESHDKLSEDVKASGGDKESSGGSEKAIETIEGRSGKANGPGKKNGDSSSATSATYSAASNSAAYSAAHNSSYEQYGSRYAYPNSGYASYGQYYQGYYPGGGHGGY